MKSDLFDVLAHVAYALPPLTREDRAANAKIEITTHFSSQQQVFHRSLHLSLTPWFSASR